MPRQIALHVACLSTVLMATSAAAQPRAPVPPSAPQQASAAGGLIRGIVRDDAGAAVRDVAVIALGTTLASARTDATGRYQLALPVGDYILRATRDGYVSTFREAIRMQTSVQLERNITLTRQGATGRQVLLAGTGLGDLTSWLPIPDAKSDKDADHSHDEAAWRLRYLPRTALRDVGAGGDAAATDVLTPPSFFGSDFTGQVNFLTTSTVASSSARTMPTDWSRGVASASLGAHMGAGDWIVRGAFNSGDVSSWVLHGEYRSSNDQPHRLALGVSHSAQTILDRDTDLPISLQTASAQSRSVGEVYGFDRWRAASWLELGYGLRLDRYDYLATPALVSPEAGLRVQVVPRTFAVMSASHRMVAPGADEFLPPSATGPWLPPQRTFSSLGGAPLAAESVDTYELGFDQQFGHDDNLRTVSVRRFRQSTEDQVATLFGVDVEGDSAHYYVATPGDAQVDGWSVGIAGRLSRNVRGRVDYSLGQTAWSPESGAALLARVAPSAVRDGRESLHDLTTTLATRFPSTSTEVSMVYRVNSAFSQAGSVGRSPLLDGRFDVEVHQALPYQPIRGGQLEVLFALRNLFYDVHETRSFYDELLTVKPPMRLVGGIQIRF